MGASLSARACMAQLAAGCAAWPGRLGPAPLPFFTDIGSVGTVPPAFTRTRRHKLRFENDPDGMRIEMFRNAQSATGTLG